MNKQELACLVAKQTGQTIAEVTPVIKSLFEIMADKLMDGEKICITALGIFELKPRKQRRGYDPHRKIPIIIPESMSLKLNVSPSFQKKIRERYDHVDVSDTSTKEVFATSKH